MSALTVNKLKKLLCVSPQSNKTLTAHATAPVAATAITAASHQQNKNGGPESLRLIAEINQCGYYYVRGVAVPYPAGASTVPAPILSKTVPASNTTALLVEASLIAANAPNNPDTRFIEFFPPPVPPPQQLQPDFVKYKINYEPVYVVPPCVGPRRFEA